MQESARLTPSILGKYEKLINLLAFVVADSRSYIVIDRIVRAYDKDFVEQSVYEAIRYIFPDIKKCAEFEEGTRTPTGEKDEERCKIIKNALGDYSIPENEIKLLLGEIEKGKLSVARKIAIQALAKALSIKVTKSTTNTKT